MPRQADRLAAVLDACERAGVTVEWEAGWRTRGRRSFAPKGFTVHHDASREGSSARHVVRDGHSRVPGPLCHAYLERDGTLVAIAAGRANHAGRGGWRGLTGNSSVWGLEIANNGRGERYSEGQLEAVRALVAAFAQVDGVSPVLVHAHHEWAPSRKVDPAVDPERRHGSWRMAPWRDLARNGPDSDDDMEALMAKIGPPLQIVKDEKGDWWLYLRWREEFAYIKTPEALDRLKDRARKDDRYAETRNDWRSEWFQGMERLADRT